MALFAGSSRCTRCLTECSPKSIGPALINRPAETKFPAAYDHCTYRGLRPLLANWRDVAITPLFLGANYLRSAPLLQALFVSYENWATDADKVDLASHYIVSARTAVGTRARCRARPLLRRPHLAPPMTLCGNARLAPAPGLPPRTRAWEGRAPAADSQSGPCPPGPAGSTRPVRGRRTTQRLSPGSSMTAARPILQPWPERAVSRVDLRVFSSCGGTS